MTDQFTAANPRIVTCDPVEGYSPQVGRYVAQLNEVRADLLHELDGLTVEQIDWHPDERTESIGTLLLHFGRGRMVMDPPGYLRCEG